MECIMEDSQAEFGEFFVQILSNSSVAVLRLTETSA